MNKKIIIDCIADLHGYYPKLEGGDLLIVAGDLTARDTHEEYWRFYDWFDHQNYKCKIFICGNHDGYIEEQDNDYLLDLAKSGYDRCIYLCDSGTEFENLRIWGSPWTKTFEGMNPHCMAFTVDTEEELAEKWALIPDDTDILVTHGPMHGCLDEIKPHGKMGGSISLAQKIHEIKPTIHCCGHIHEAYEKYETSKASPFYPTIFINASHVNEHYQPVNKPIRIIL